MTFDESIATVRGIRREANHLGKKEILGILGVRGWGESRAISS